MHNSDAFSSAFDFASGKTGERFQNPLWQITEMFLGSPFRKAIHDVKSFGTKIVATAVKSRQSKMISDPRGKTFEAISGSLIHSFLDSLDDHEMVANAALNYLSAGRYNTIHTSLLWWLTMNRKRHYCTSVDMDFLPPYAQSSCCGCNPGGGRNSYHS